MTLPVGSIATAATPLRLCRCGHEVDAHQHYRGGTDCAVCGRARCRAFRFRAGRGARSSIGRRFRDRPA